MNKPDSPSIPLLLYTHKRADYLKLTLNSLLYSLNGDIENITIFMSAPTPEVENVILNIIEKYPNINCFKAPNNICFACVNAYLQIIKPDRFVCFEEDFILPQHTKYLLPYWNRQFYALLDEYDTVHFQTSLENRPNFFNDGSKRTTTTNWNHEWITDKNQDIQLTGNGMAVKTNFYAPLGAKNPPFYIYGDGAVYSLAEKVCISSIHGYHIGWNQEMDGHINVGDFSRFPEPEPVQNIINYKTGETLTIDLRNII